MRTKVSQIRPSLPQVPEERPEGWRALLAWAGLSCEASCERRVLLFEQFE